LRALGERENILRVGTLIAISPLYTIGLAFPLGMLFIVMAITS